MPAADHSIVKKLVEKPGPLATFRRVDREEVKKALGNRPRAVKHFNPPATTPTGKVEKATAQKKAGNKPVALFDQGPIRDPTQFPYNCIGICFVQYGDSNTYCTGTLVGSNIVLTVGNAIPWNQPCSMQFVPGYNNGNAPNGVINVVGGYGYNPGTSTSDDFLVCQLETKIGNEIGRLGSWGSNSGDDYRAPGIDWESDGYPDQSILIGVTAFSVDNTSGSDGNNSLDLETEPPWISGGWVGAPVWSDYPFNGLDESDYGAHVAAVVAGGGLSVDWLGNIDQYQVNEGGEDMVNLVIYGIDNWS